MYNFTPARSFGRVFGTGPRIPVTVPNFNGPVNFNRQGRHEARGRRRDGNWDILGVPTALLWFDEVCATAALEGNSECPEPPVVDLWP